CARGMNTVMEDVW
nr:immunoglobulin heavy chain junction region [Macaca mulatta]